MRNFFLFFCGLDWLGGWSHYALFFDDICKFYDVFFHGRLLLRWDVWGDESSWGGFDSGQDSGTAALVERVVVGQCYLVLSLLGEIVTRRKLRSTASRRITKISRCAHP